MANPITIQPTSLGGLVRVLSGIFSIKEYKNGLTKKECSIIELLIKIVGEDKITNKVKEQLSTELNQGLQVTTNYINKLKRKGVIVNNKVHPIFFQQEIKIFWRTA